MIPRNVVNDLIFGELGDANGRHSLRELIYQLKNISVPIRAEKDSLGLESGILSSDFLRCCSDSRLDDELIEAIGGGFLPGYAPLGSDSFREWYERYRAKSIAEISRILTRDLERAMSAGDWNRGERLARAFLAIDTFSQAATIALADCLTMSGAPNAAIRVLDAFAHDTGTPAETLVAMQRRRRRIKELSGAYSTIKELPFVGRSSEMDLLRGYMTRARKGNAAAACLVGDAGIGKTRIASEFAQYAALDGWATLRVALRPTDQGRALSVFADLIPSLLEMPGAIGCAPESLESLDRVIGRHEKEGEDQAANAEPIAGGILIALCDILDATSAERPLLITIDDIQWADRASASTLCSIVSGKHSHRVFFLLTAREKTSFADLEYAEEAIHFISTTPLDRDNTKTILLRELPGESGELHEWMSGVSGGNPFFLQCLVDEFRRTGERFVVPRKLSELIDQRISSLSAMARQLLSTIIRLGGRATPQRLADATGLPPQELYSASLELERSRLVYGGTVLEPQHWLIAESEQRLSPELSTKLIHLRIATVLERELTPQLDPSLLWEVAEHWIAAGEGHRAVFPLSKCAAHALRIGRARYASEIWLRAAGLAHVKEREDLLVRAIRAGSPSGQIDVVIRASLLLQSTPTRPLPIDVEIYILLAKVIVEDDQTHSIPRLIEHMRNGDIAPGHRTHAAFALLVICDHERCHHVALSLADDIRSLWEELAGIDEVGSLLLRLIFQSSVGDVQDAPAVARRLLEIAKDARCDIAADLQRKAAIGLWRAGLTSESRMAFQNSFANGEKAGLLLLKAVVGYMMAGILQDIGDFEESDYWLEIANQNHREAGTGPHDFLKIATEAERAVARDIREDILRISEVAARLGRERVSKRVRAWSAGLDLYARYLRGEEADIAGAESSVFEQLVIGHETGEMADFQIAILGRILCSKRLISDARRVITKYLSVYRRPAMPITYPLRMLASELGILIVPMPCQRDLPASQSSSTETVTQ